jgi:hypothetical protein
MSKLSSVVRFATGKSVGDNLESLVASDKPTKTVPAAAPVASVNYTYIAGAVLIGVVVAMVLLKRK